MPPAGSAKQVKRREFSPRLKQMRAIGSSKVIPSWRSGAASARSLAAAKPWQPSSRLAPEPHSMKMNNAPGPSPKGTSENNPAFQGCVSPGLKLSPKGTGENLPQPSLRDLSNNRDPSVETLGYSQSSLRDGPANPSGIARGRAHSANACGGPG